MEFHLDMDCDNAAFADGAAGTEIARILRSIVVDIEDGRVSGTLRDVNGHNVGDWELIPDDEDDDEDDEDNTDDQDEAEAIASNDEPLYITGRTGTVDELEFAMRAWWDRNRIKTFDPDKVDYAKLAAFLRDEE